MRLSLLALLLAGCGRISFDSPSTPADADSGVDDGALSDDALGPAPLPGMGYFVEADAFGANFGGTAGAVAACLDQLTSREWLGRTDAMSRGALRAPYVHAWLCTTASCFDLVPNRTYAYATTNNPAAGGVTFTSTAQGYIEDDGLSYDEVFGIDTVVHEYFTGRDQDNLPSGESCNDWTSDTGATPIAVSDTSFYPEKLRKYERDCDAEINVLCVVDPID